jgi:hypothetical protein
MAHVHRWHTAASAPTGADSLRLLVVSDIVKATVTDPYRTLIRTTLHLARAFLSDQFKCPHLRNSHAGRRQQGAALLKYKVPA